MIDAKLIEEWYGAARDEFWAIIKAYISDQCKVEPFESGNHYSVISVTMKEEGGLIITYRGGGSLKFSDYVGSSGFPATTFLEIVAMVNGEIEKRWKFLEDYRERQRKAAEDMDSILRKQISSWKLLGKDVKPP